jgi:DNA-binding GntR family transcriptional regulator
MAAESAANAALAEDQAPAPEIETTPAPILRRPLHDEATERIRDMIVEGRLAAGEWINEAELCQQLQISRTPLREALKVLATEGLVELVPRRGAHVARLSARELADLFEALSGVEGLAAELAAARMSEADFEQLRQLQLRIEQRHKAKDRLTYFHENHELHIAIVRCSGNSAIADIHARLIARVRRARYQAILSEARWNAAVEEHAQILAALEKRDARRAGKLMRQHVAHTGDVVRASMDERIREPS